MEKESLRNNGGLPRVYVRMFVELFLGRRATKRKNLTLQEMIATKSTVLAWKNYMTYSPTCKYLAPFFYYPGSPVAQFGRATGC